MKKAESSAVFPLIYQTVRRHIIEGLILNSSLEMS